MNRIHINHTPKGEIMSDQIPPVPPPASFPVQAPAPAGYKKGLAIASLVLGILSLCGSLVWFCGVPLSIVGVVLGFLGIKGTGRSLAIGGLILSAVGLLLAIVFAILGVVASPVIQQLQNQIISNMGY